MTSPVPIPAKNLLPVPYFFEKEWGEFKSFTNLFLCPANIDQKQPSASSKEDKKHKVQLISPPRKIRAALLSKEEWAMLSASRSYEQFLISMPAPFAKIDEGHKELESLIPAIGRRLLVRIDTKSRYAFPNNAGNRGKLELLRVEVDKLYWIITKAYIKSRVDLAVDFLSIALNQTFFEIERADSWEKWVYWSFSHSLFTATIGRLESARDHALYLMSTLKEGEETLREMVSTEENISERIAQKRGLSADLFLQWQFSRGSNGRFRIHYLQQPLEG